MVKRGRDDAEHARAARREQVLRRLRWYPGSTADDVKQRLGWPCGVRTVLGELARRGLAHEQDGAWYPGPLRNDDEEAEMVAKNEKTTPVDVSVSPPKLTGDNDRLVWATLWWLGGRATMRQVRERSGLSTTTTSSTLSSLAKRYPELIHRAPEKVDGLIVWCIPRERLRGAPGNRATDEGVVEEPVDEEEVKQEEDDAGNLGRPDPAVSDEDLAEFRRLWNESMNGAVGQEIEVTGPPVEPALMVIDKLLEILHDTRRDLREEREAHEATRAELAAVRCRSTPDPFASDLQWAAERFGLQGASASLILGVLAARSAP